jgi:hypothetical protein
VAPRLAWRSDRPALTVEGTNEGTTWFAAPASAPLPLHFSDGSEVTIERSGRARVTARTATGATVVVEHGEIRAQIRHRPETSWRFEAGPYVVRVTGTMFFLSWDPVDASLVVRLEEGSVVVSGCDEDGRRVVTGGELRSRCGRFRADSASPWPCRSPRACPCASGRSREGAWEASRLARWAQAGSIGIHRDPGAWRRPFTWLKPKPPAWAGIIAGSAKSGPSPDPVTFKLLVDFGIPKIRFENAGITNVT